MGSVSLNRTSLLHMTLDFHISFEPQIKQNVMIQPTPRYSSINMNLTIIIRMQMNIIISLLSQMAEHMLFSVCASAFV